MSPLKAHHTLTVSEHPGTGDLDVREHSEVVEHDAAVASGARQGHQGPHVGALAAVGDPRAHGDGVVL